MSSDRWFEIQERFYGTAFWRFVSAFLFAREWQARATKAEWAVVQRDNNIADGVLLHTSWDNCPNCGSVVVAKANFCHKCGAEQVLGLPVFNKVGRILEDLVLVAKVYQDPEKRVSNIVEMPVVRYDGTGITCFWFDGFSRKAIFVDPANQVLYEEVEQPKKEE